MKRWSLNKKIYFIIFVMSLGLAAVSVVGIYEMNEINSKLESITKERLPNLIKTQEIMEHFYIQQINERNFVLIENKEGRENSRALIERRHNEMLTIVEARRKMALSEEAIKDLNEFQAIYDKWKKLNGKIQEMVDSGKTREAALEIAETGAQLRHSAEDVLVRMNKRSVGEMDNESMAAAKTYNNAKFIVAIASIMSLAFGLALAIFSLKSLSKVIDNVISSLSDNSQQVTSAAGQIAASSEELSQAVTEQASSLEETASSIEEMSSMVQKNADNSRQATDIAGSSMDSAAKGQKVVVNMMNAIEDINTSNKHIMDQINHSNQQISEIVDVIREIGTKTKVINDIVFQTKLLSFNASVEAARAGEQGKGFAVVAEEVGNLAAMSGSAANEISVLLDSSIEKVETIVRETKTKVEVLIKEGTVKVDMGNRIAKECSIVLEEIVQSTNTVTKMTNEISTACQEQSLGVQEITRAMNQLDQVTQTNATTSEEAASAAEQLSAQAMSLKGVVDLLVLTIKGGDAEVQQNKPQKVSIPKNVVEFKKPKVQSKPLTTQYKKVVGLDHSPIPRANDPRFEEV